MYFAQLASVITVSYTHLDVYKRQGLQPINISELIEKTGIEYERLSEILLQLQLDGMVEQPMENYYARVVV